MVVAEPWARPVEDVLEAVGADPETGLTAQQARDRLREHGPNELRPAPPVPLWRKVLAQFQDPLIYLLLGAVLVSLLAWMVEGAEGWPVDAVVISVVVVLNAVIGLVQESRADTAVAALQAMTTATSTVLRDGRPQVVPSADLVPGDLLVLAEGDAVGADARVVRAVGLRVSEASLTGESAAVTKEETPLEGPVSLGDRVSMVYKGTAVVQGTGRAVVTATGMATEMGAIAEMLEETVEEPSPLQREIAGVSRMLGRLVVVIAVVVMAVTLLVNEVSTVGDLVTVLLLGVSLAVAAVPEGLPAILSVVLAIGVQRMARHNAVVTELHSVETLGSASVIASDKTGTLTKNEMTIRRVVTASGTVELTGTGYGPQGEALVSGRPLRQAEPALRSEARMVLAGGCLSNDARLETGPDGQVQAHGDPTEAAFLVAAGKVEGASDTIARYRRCGEVPFTSERKMMSTLQQRDDRAVRIVTKGAPDVLLGRCTGLQVGDAVVELTEEHRRRALTSVDEMSRQAFRTLGVAYREVPRGSVAGPLEETAEHELVYLGAVGIIDPPRPEAAEAVRQAHGAGIRVLMITGDHPGTAARIASDLGIVGAGEVAVPGASLDALDAAALGAVARRSSVYARVAPQHKLAIVDALQADGHVVAMTGDGVNDAPALKSADIGVAMGITGTEVTKQAARMILADDNFATIVAAVRQGRTIFENIKKFLRYLLSSNMGEVATVFFGVVLAGVLGLTGAGEGGVVVPLLATQILWINLVTDSTPALAMGVDPEVDDVMRRRPRQPGERIIDRRMWSGILLIGLVMAVLTLFSIDLFLPGGLVEGGDSLEVARTAGFTTLVLAQLFNAFNSRSETTSAFRHLFANPWLWAAVTLGAVLQVAVVHVPFLQIAFGTAALEPRHWAACVALASGVLWFAEVRKLILRRRPARSRRPSGSGPQAG